MTTDCLWSCSGTRGRVLTNVQMSVPVAARPGANTRIPRGCSLQERSPQRKSRGCGFAPGAWGAWVHAKHQLPGREGSDPGLSKTPPHIRIPRRRGRGRRL